MVLLHHHSIFPFHHNGMNQLSTVNNWLKHLYAEFQLTTSRFNCTTCHGCYGGRIAPDYYIPTTAVIARSFTHYREICPHSRGVSAVTAAIGYRLYRYRIRNSLEPSRDFCPNTATEPAAILGGVESTVCFSQKPVHVNNTGTSASRRCWSVDVSIR